MATVRSGRRTEVDFILQPWVDFIAPVTRGIEEKAGMPGVLSYHPAKKDMGQEFYWTFSNAPASVAVVSVSTGWPAASFLRRTFSVSSRRTTSYLPCRSISVS